MGAARKLAAFDPDGDSTGPPSLRSDTATVAQILDWFADSNRGKQCQSVEADRSRIYRLFAGEYGKLRCTDARPHNLQAFLDAHVGARSPWTIKRWNQTIQRAFNCAMKLGLILNNPFKGLTFPSGEDGRDWTFEEYQAVLRAASPNRRRFFIFMRFSGMRPGEVRDLLWPDIKPEIEAIVIVKHKTAKKTRVPRRIPLNTVLKKLLAFQRKNVAIACPYVFPNAVGQHLTMRSLNKNFGLMKSAVGLPRSLKIHGLRHTFGTHAIMNGLDVATVGTLLGHKNLATTQRYVHLAGKTAHLNAAMEQAIQSRPAADLEAKLAEVKTVQAIRSAHLCEPFFAPEVLAEVKTIQGVAAEVKTIQGVAVYGFDVSAVVSPDLR